MKRTTVTHLFLEGLELIKQVLLQESVLERLDVPLEALDIPGDGKDALQFPELEGNAAKGKEKGRVAKERLTAAAPEARNPFNATLQVRVRDAQILAGEVEKGSTLVMR
jgi:hypothetical protein